MAGVMQEVGAVAGLLTNVPGGPQMAQAYWRGSRERSTAATATAARLLETAMPHAPQMEGFAGGMR